MERLPQGWAALHPVAVEPGAAATGTSGPGRAALDPAAARLGAAAIAMVELLWL